MVDVDDSCQFSADSQPKSTGLVWGLAATQRSVYIHQMNRVNSRNDFGHDDRTITIVMAIISIIIIIVGPKEPHIRWKPRSPNQKGQFWGAQCGVLQWYYSISNVVAHSDSAVNTYKKTACFLFAFNHLFIAFVALSGILCTATVSTVKNSALSHSFCDMHYILCELVIL